MKKDLSFHDFCITGLLYDQVQKKLFIQTESTIEKKVLLMFSNVSGWDLTSFEDQNILFQIYEFNKKNLPSWLKKDFNIPQEYLNLMDKEEAMLFYLEPSIGLGGYIIANNMENMNQSYIGIFPIPLKEELI